MRFILPKLNINPKLFLKKCGYIEISDFQTGQISYARSLEISRFYPRFHIYLGEKQDGTVINLHLDMKKPSYEGAAAHSGEYESPVVKTEAKRIKGATEKFAAKSPGAGQIGFQKPLTLKRLLMRLFNIFKKNIK